MRLVTPALAGLVLAAGTAGADRPTPPETATVVVRGHVGGQLDEYMSRLEALGFSGGLADRVETVVRVDFERGSVYSRFVWGSGGGLEGIQAGPEPPGARYVPVSETELIAFRLGDEGPRRRVSFEGEGGSTVLVVPGPDGPQRLPRVP